MMPGYLLLLPALALLVWLADGIRRIGAVSHGTPIGKRPGTALLLIDLQAVFWDEGHYDDAAKAAAQSAILNAVSDAKAADSPVIAVRQEWSIPSTKVIAKLTMQGKAVEGTPGTQIAAPFEGLADHVLIKRFQDAFETGELDRLLERLDVGTLRIAGLDLSYCVAKTALAALRRGYHVELITRASLCENQTAADRTRDMLSSKGVHLR
jgi:nicotinamidase-related amidase